jgi:hypothetical protein
MDNGKIICCPLLTPLVSGSPIVQNGMLVGKFIGNMPDGQDKKYDRDFFVPVIFFMISDK